MKSVKKNKENVQIKKLNCVVRTNDKYEQLVYLSDKT